MKLEMDPVDFQQIYNFTRELFPFFQTAPDGWKNTIRHNLCFNNSFRKTCHQVFRDGKRKSCFWHLTLDGHRRLKDEIRTLTGESLKQLERSMSRPDVIQSLFALTAGVEASGFLSVGVGRTSYSEQEGCQ
ncbi:forkhead box protein N5-like [Perca flavescens]|uniref:forkhead box protein N5-like n=1 Tax=Perca flavescens TaxID=8167 RepID=UPI00106E0D0D|nr:forkhead box protein N5-like [Perca flavescens]